MSQLKGKIALITGGTSGIGAATAKVFHKEGATVIVTGSSEKSVETAKAALPGIEVLQSNAGSAQAAAELVAFIAAKHGHLDVLSVNAGIGSIKSIEEVDETLFDEVLQTNLRGPYFLLKYASPVLADGASVILTSSTSAVQGMAGVSVYAASKAALRSLGMTLAVEWAPRRIRVNTITPGPIATSIGGKMDLTPQQIAGFVKMVEGLPLKRIGQPEEVAAAELYFASDASGFTTGAELRIDGGLTLL